MKMKFGINVFIFLYIKPVVPLHMIIIFPKAKKVIFDGEQRRGTCAKRRRRGDDDVEDEGIPG